MEKIETNWDKHFSQPPRSYWIDSTQIKEYPALQEDIRVDVAVVGGGITGITCGYLLKTAGLRVAVLEAETLFHGTTGHTTAKVTSQHGLIYGKVSKKLGEEKARQYAEANETAIRLIASLVKEKNIDCHFHPCQAVVYTEQVDYVTKIEEEVEAASRAGIRAAYHSTLSLPFPVKAAVSFEDQARFHPLRYLVALADAIPGDGSGIYTHTKVLDIHQDGDTHVSTEGGLKVFADSVIIASHYPFYDGYGFYFSRLYPYRSYALGVKARHSIPDAMYITAEEPGRSLRLEDLDQGQLLIVSGEHHKPGQGEDTTTHYLNLKAFAEDHFDVEEIPWRWSTQDYSTPNEVPYIGRLTSNTPNLYVATGYGKWGMTTSTAAAMILRDLILKNENPWEAVFSPSRSDLGASVKNFVVENANVAKELIKSKLSAIPDEVQVPVGEGKVLEIDGQRVGAFRDADGQLYLVDTTCPHMRCELQWNSAERSWDCPCHGSRFDIDGHLLQGPALKELEHPEA